MFEIGEWGRGSLKMMVNVASKCIVGLCIVGLCLLMLCLCCGELIGAEASVAQLHGTAATLPGSRAQELDVGQLSGQGDREGQGEQQSVEKTSKGQVTLGPSCITAMAYSVSNDLVYAVDGSCDGLIIIDEMLRLRIHVGPLGFPAVCGLTFDSEGQMFAVEGQGDQLLKVDPLSGKATRIGPLGFSSVQSLACDRFNRLYGVDTATDQLVRIDKHTGQATAVASLDAPSIFSLAFVKGQELYGVDIASNLLYKIDVQTGACVRLSSTRERCCETHGLAACRDGRLLAYAVKHDVLFELNWSDGTVGNMTQIRELSVSRFVIQAIPDALPTRILLGLSLLALLMATCIQGARLTAQYVSEAWQYVSEAWQQTRDVFANQRAPG